MSEQTEIYIGETIRKAIKDRYLKNQFVVQALNGAGVEMSESAFSNKIYGQRDKFTDTEIKAIGKILKIKL